MFFREWMTSILEERDEEALADMAAAGVAVVRLTPEEEAAWLEFCKPIYDVFVEKSGPDGAKILEIAAATR